MQIAKSEIIRRAQIFQSNWEGRGHERQDTHRFYIEFFNVFGINQLRVDLFERFVEKLTDEKKGGFIDLFWPKKILVEQKSIGRDLHKAQTQAESYLFGIETEDQPRYIMVSDFQNFIITDRGGEKNFRFTLAEFHKYIDFFADLFADHEGDFDIPENLDVKAAEKMGELHDALKDSGYDGHDLEQYLVRLAFCLFASDTIFNRRNMFIKFLRNKTRDDGDDVGLRLQQLFDVLNSNNSNRPIYTDHDLLQFPYINGGLFSDTLKVAPFNLGMRKILIDLCKYDWSQISPTIFGALFQSVLLPPERREQGAHYTTEENIMKLIAPLFLDELRAEWQKISNTQTASLDRIKNFQKKLRELTFFDPACGCGNFLVVAYREIRRLEHDIIKKLLEISPSGGKQTKLEQSFASMVDVDQFYGIELNEFAVRIAETALWMTDHLMNKELSSLIKDVYIRIPLQKSPRILHADALETDWSQLIEPENCSFIFGNPPFGGAKFQSDKQRSQTHREGELGGSGGTLDYVTNWFFKAAKFNQKSDTPFAFVAVNSICQGEQVAQFWPIMLERFQLSIKFAYQPFVWTSEARGKAHVHCVIIGLVKCDHVPESKRLFTYPDPSEKPIEIACKAISPYLFDASNLHDPNLVITETKEPLNGLPAMIIGSKPIDGGNYIFDEERRRLFLYKEPMAERFMHPYIGAKELINGEKRWILALQNATLDELNLMKETRKLINAVKKFRQNSHSKGTNAIADFPRNYHVNVIPEQPFLAVPETSSETRDYVPIAWLKPPVIPSNAIRLIENPTLVHFSLLTSRIHMVWLRNIGGRLESRFRYSIGMVYNTFPIPPISDDKLKKLEKYGQAILDARAEYPNDRLKLLYDPDLMPNDLKRAHLENDRAVEAIYSDRKLSNDRERIELLFRLYEQRAPSLGLNHISPPTAPKKRSKN
ncbi:MAG: N-6 DNA methylase [Candidatus Symbiobacter sp.]|nr:N-6 DNA methylase [Candidatus Symbiobacter sp.]